MPRVRFIISVIQLDSVVVITTLIVRTGRMTNVLSSIIFNQTFSSNMPWIKLPFSVYISRSSQSHDLANLLILTLITWLMCIWIGSLKLSFCKRNWGSVDLYDPILQQRGFPQNLHTPPHTLHTFLTFSTLSFHLPDLPSDPLSLSTFPHTLHTFHHILYTWTLSHT